MKEPMTVNTLPQNLAPHVYRRFIHEQLGRALHPGLEDIPLAESGGRVCATEILARQSIPSFANSQMDGYAITEAAATRANRVFRVGTEIAAGHNLAATAPLAVDDDLAYPIMTGAPLPAGYRCVIPEEQAKPLGKSVGGFAAAGEQVELAPGKTGQFVRLPGEDVHVNQLLAQPGTRISPALLGAFAAQGFDTVPLIAPLRVLVLTGGNEISPQGSLAPGKIFDSNGPMLVELLRQDGAQVTHRHMSDSVAELIGLLEKELSGGLIDLVISSGGISHGKYEVVRNAVQELAGITGAGVRVLQSWFGHVAQQPGGPQGYTELEVATTEPLGLKPVPLISFPGNPVSTLISYTLFLRSLILGGNQKMDGVPIVGTRYGVLVSSQPVSAPVGKTRYLRARAQQEYEENGSYRVNLYPDPNPGSHLLHRAAQSNVLIEIAPGATVKNGDSLPWYPI